MGDILLEYMKKFRENQNVPEGKKEPGPVITISRETGCGANEIAAELVRLLNERAKKAGKTTKWQWIDRQILEKSAEQLNLDPAKITKVLTDHDRGSLDQIVEALSGHYHKSDLKIRKTLHDVIQQFAEQGYVVIIGRGGAAVSHHIRKSVHVRLEAPLEYRTEAFRKKYSYSFEFARDFIKKTDAERDEFNNRVAGERAYNLLYDCILYRNRFSTSEIVDIILKMAELRGILF
jgi:cytidylate kinase